ncbi:MAG: FkbM family methyltransferase [Solirubrobacteraceae bacterium]
MVLKNSLFRVKIVNFISKNRKNYFFKNLYKFALYFIKAYNNVSYNSVQNGELRVFGIIKNYGCNNFIECGANDGLDAIAYSNISQSTNVYALEIVPPTFEVLVNNTKNYSKIKSYNFGLGDFEGKINITHYPEASYLSSNYNTSRNIKQEVYECQIKTGDNFCNENNLEHINFLKIDVEGMDFQVIKGFDNMIKQQKIDVIQFEYTYGFIYAGCFLKNVFDYFSDKNYIIGKIYPDKVDFLEYSYQLDNFFDANYIIVNKDKTPLIKSLQNS